MISCGCRCHKQKYHKKDCCVCTIKWERKLKKLSKGKASFLRKTAGRIKIGSPDKNFIDAFNKGYFKGVLDSEWGQITSEELLNQELTKEEKE